MSFESANSDDPKAIVKAAQAAVLNALHDVIKDMRNVTKNPGLTWNELDYLIEGFKKKEPKIIEQEFEA